MSDWMSEDVIEPPAARFCGRCGNALMAGDAGCAACMQAEADTLEARTLTDKPSRPSFAMAMALFGILLATFLPFAFIEEDPDFTYQNTVQILDTLVVLFFAALCWRTAWPLIKTVPFIWCLAAIPTGVITIAIATLFIGIAVMLTGIEEVMMIQPAFDAGYGWLFLFLTIVAQPAIIEELAFRGVIFDGLRTALSDRETVIVSGLMFMVLHLSPAAFPHLMIMGILLGYIRLKTGSIWPCILLHATHNALAIAYEYRVYQ